MSCIFFTKLTSCLIKIRFERLIGEEKEGKTISRRKQEWGGRRRNPQRRFSPRSICHHHPSLSLLRLTSLRCESRIGNMFFLRNIHDSLFVRCKSHHTRKVWSLNHTELRFLDDEVYTGGVTLKYIFPLASSQPITPNKW